MNIYSLMIKTHKITGLRYLCQTSQDPYKYCGSGKDWKIHLKEHGKEHDTEILLQTTSKEERNWWGRFYSSKFNIVNAQDDFGNKIWANKIPETGGGGSYGKEWQNKIKKAIKDISSSPTYINPFAKRKDGSSVASDKIKDGTHNWVGKNMSGGNNPAYDHTIYCFENIQTKERIFTTRYNFYTNYTVSRIGVERLVNKTRKKHKGWIYISE